ncbi:hypothetical protein CFB41_17580 [Burkholderia sp. AU33803]|nr:hypothetical protein CFB41_17580 [Burkholderia sp. AU33803]PRD91003.1 hypothetical protein C6P88_20270 [Burkholderia contaminans]
MRDPISRAYYAREIQHGKRHNQAPLALSRNRLSVSSGAGMSGDGGREDASDSRCCALSDPTICQDYW